MVKVKRVLTTRADTTAWAMNEIMAPVYMVNLIAEVDATRLEQIREDAKRARMIPPSFTALVIKAAALTMRKNPEANRAILGPPFFRRLYQFENADISVAVEKGLPAQPGAPYATPIFNAAEKPLSEITSELKDLANCDESNNRGLRTFLRILKFVPRPFSLWIINAPYWFPSLWAKYRGCAAWVNAPSKAGVDLVFTTWPWPITFSFGQVRRRPFVSGLNVEPRLTMPIVMVFDRRIMGGGPAGRIFVQFKEILEKGEFELRSEMENSPKNIISHPA